MCSRAVKPSEGLTEQEPGSSIGCRRDQQDNMGDTGKMPACPSGWILPHLSSAEPTDLAEVGQVAELSLSVFQEIVELLMVESIDASKLHCPDNDSRDFCSGH